MGTYNDYYVYKWFIKNTRETIYIGKGRKYRYKKVGLHSRNKYFLDMYNSHDCDVIILARDMSEEEAFSLEKDLIFYYRHFTKDRLTNICDGGEGVSGHHWSNEQKHEISCRVANDKNPNYKHYWTDEMKAAASNRVKLSGRYCGSKNPRATKIKCVETGEIYNTMKDAAKHLGLKSQASITLAIKNENRTARGMHFKLI